MRSGSFQAGMPDHVLDQACLSCGGLCAILVTYSDQDHCLRSLLSAVAYMYAARLEA